MTGLGIPRSSRLRRSDHTRLTVLAGFFWLGILIFLTLNDYATRGGLQIPGK